MAAFNGLGFLFWISGITYVDAHLTTHIVYGARIYPHGYLLAMIGGILVGGCTFSSIIFPKPQLWCRKALLTAGSVLLTGALFMPFFTPEFPHLAITEWAFIFAAISGLGCIVHFFPIEDKTLNVDGLVKEARIEWIKNHVVMWRTMSVSFIIGLFGILIPWINFVYGVMGKVVTSPEEILLLDQFGTLGIVGICIYYLYAVVYQALLKSMKFNNMLLKILDSK